MQTLVDAVRSSGALQPVIATGIDSGNNLSAWTRFRPHDPAHQLVAGFHAYNFDACVTASCWEQQVGPLARRVPVVTTELGAADCSDRFINRFMSWADSRGISYIAWAWDPSSCNAPSLVSSWYGKPTPYGSGFRSHLLALYRRRHRG